MLEEFDDREVMETAKELMKTGCKNPFTVPDGYFEQLGTQLNARLVITETAGNSNAFELPADYFDNLSQQIRARVLIENVQPPAEQPFGVPDGYFEKLDERIQQATAPQVPVRRLWPSLTRYAAAACVVILAGLGLFYNQEKPDPAVSAPVAHTSTPLADQYLYDIDEHVIVEHIELGEAEAVNATPTQAEVESYILNHYSQTDLISAL